MVSAAQDGEGYFGTQLSPVWRTLTETDRLTIWKKNTDLVHKTIVIIIKKLIRHSEGHILPLYTEEGIARST